MEARICTKCGLEKSLESFHLRSRLTGRRKEVCKACIKAYHATPRIRESKRKSQRRYAQTEAGRAAEARHSPKRQQRVKKLGRDSVYYAVKMALRDGRLVKRSCEICGDPKVQAHHSDYSQPLNVRWLCHFHHAQEHAGSFFPTGTTATTTHSHH